MTTNGVTATAWLTLLNTSAAREFNFRRLQNGDLATGRRFFILIRSSGRESAQIIQAAIRSEPTPVGCYEFFLFWRLRFYLDDLFVFQLFQLGRDDHLAIRHAGVGIIITLMIILGLEEFFQRHNLRDGGLEEIFLRLQL